MFRIKKRFGIAFGLMMLATGLLLAPQSRAGVDGDVRAAMYTDNEAVGVGAGLLTGIGDSHSWFFNPNVEAAFGDEADVMSLNGDVHYDFADTKDITFWLGGGPALVMSNPEGNGDTDTDAGLNLLTGLGDKDGSIRPYAQVRGLISDENEVVLAGGIRF
ncbi:MAG TPA: hypothetical protein VFR10_10700 [bacterium]|nr:hypothetical protein [bacterium]